MSDEFNIDEILKDFQKQKQNRENGVEPTADKQREIIDFSRQGDAVGQKKQINDDPLGILSADEMIRPDDAKYRREPDAPSKPKRERKPKDKKERKPEKRKQRSAEKPRTKKERKPVDKGIIRTLILAVVGIVAAIGIVTGGIFAIKTAVNNSRRAYLKPYEEKYDGVEFPVGIMEKYCDAYGQNSGTVGYITIDDIKLSAPVDTTRAKDKPYAGSVTKGAVAYNNVIYMPDSLLEAYYKDIDSYNNKASGLITYSDLFTESTYKVVGVFYTNTNEKDDSGYIFPYNVVEKQTKNSQKEFLDRLQTRFIYSTSVTITTGDKLLTLSCPTTFRDGFRFVVVAVERSNTDKLTASEKTSIRYPNVIYIERNEKNPYELASKWYPEIVYTDDSGAEKTKQLTIDDFK